jgi:hypothetical protein
MAGGSKGSSVASVMAAVARREYAKHFVSIPICYVNLAVSGQAVGSGLAP